MALLGRNAFTVQESVNMDSFSDYNYEYMIDQIRTDPDQKIARLPILMKFDKIEELYESSLDEEVLKPGSETPT